MPVNLARWVLWGFLVVLLPLPVWFGGWAVVPAGRMLQLWAQSTELWLGVQVLGWPAVLGILAWTSGWASRAWLPRIRGSAVGLCGLLMLVLFSTFPVYKPTAGVDEQWIAFRDVYRWPVPAGS